MPNIRKLWLFGNSDAFEWPETHLRDPLLYCSEVRWLDVTPCTIDLDRCWAAASSLSLRSLACDVKASDLPTLDHALTPLPHLSSLDLVVGKASQRALNRLLPALPSLRSLAIYFTSDDQLSAYEVVEDICAHTAGLTCLRLGRATSSPAAHNRDRPPKDWLLHLSQLVTLDIDTFFLSDHPLVVGKSLRNIALHRNTGWSEGWSALTRQC